MRVRFSLTFALSIVVGSAILSSAIGTRSSEDVRAGIVHSLGEPFVLDGNPAKIGCSVGAAVWPQHGDDIKEVTRLADEALYAAKRGGKNRVVLHADA